jgi:hypothetical protein
MKYELQIHKPGIAGFSKRNEPEGFAPEVIFFNAASNTEALNMARDAYAKTGLGFSGHFNVSLAVA